MALLGGNGTGKSTTLRLLSEGLRPYRGVVRHTAGWGFCPRTRRHCS
ncbi:MAG: ATP-binding cassette domain-containing protein [Oscillospiraceae bacterium]